jgi:hypothetical protein
VVSTGVPTPESFGFDNPETTPLSIPTNSRTAPRGELAGTGETVSLKGSGAASPPVSQSPL